MVVDIKTGGINNLVLTIVADLIDLTRDDKPDVQVVVHNSNGYHETAVHQGIHLNRWSIFDIECVNSAVMCVCGGMCLYVILWYALPVTTKKEFFLV